MRDTSERTYICNANHSIASNAPISQHVGGFHTFLSRPSAIRYPPLFLLARWVLTCPVPTGIEMQLQTAKTAIEHPTQLWSVAFWEEIAISMFLVLAGGVFAGLTLGLMSLDELHLRVLATASQDSSEQKNAIAVLALLKKGRRWVLVVLLLSNVIINESLPIFLDSAVRISPSQTFPVLSFMQPMADRRWLGGRCALDDSYW
ncbi:hypothetical protein B0H19DRAFT_1276554 [Mycena capillaripes]|nr:hypothetical protein B0H19DRAFT_1276554 [Mycena capillaripes]